MIMAVRFIGYNFFHAFFFIVLLLCIKPSPENAFISGVGAVDAKAKSMCIDRERQALLIFRQGLINDYGRLSSWEPNSNKDCCKWKGVRCNNLTGHVVVLDIRSTGAEYYKKPLKGNISPSLLELVQLKYLDLSYNCLWGNNHQLPDFLGSLTQLQYLNLQHNNFVGRIPHQLGNLTNLRFLDLGFNSNLTVKNLEWLSHLRMLSYLDLSLVNLGEINWLQEVNKLPFIIELHLSSCGLPGSTSHLFPSTNSSSIPNLAFVDLSGNDYVHFFEFHWLLNYTTSVVDFDISSNSLRGPIPEDFGNMISLTNINFVGNIFEGQVSKSFRNLSNLLSLDLSWNNINGQLPEFLHNMYSSVNTSLQTLLLDGNQLSGSLPNITGFSSLRKLSLCKNKLNGSFLESFEQVSSLDYLDLSQNQMTGSLPDDLTVFPSLTWLDLHNNELHGRLPISIGQLAELEFLDVSSNSFEDTLSEVHFSNLSNLKELHLSFNSFALEFSSNWIPPFQLDVIRLANCSLGTQFPKWLQTQNNYSEIDIAYAGISDTVPDWFWDLSPRLMYLNLSYNQMSGVVPYLSSKFIHHPRIDLSSNHFEGPVPFFSPNLNILYLSKNLFSGSISLLCEIANDYFSSLDLSDNKLSGELPNCWMKMKGLVIVNLANNNFSGKIPNSMGNLYQLQILQLRNNNFSGELPFSLKNCRKLKIVDLGENKLSGKLPTWLGTHLTSLIVLILRLNTFNGSLPYQICHLNHTQVLDLSQNNISGKIPHCFDNFTSLVQSNNSSGTLVFHILFYNIYGYVYSEYYVGNALFQWKRQEAEYRKSLGQLKIIDLSSNKLVGKIPREFASLAELVSLNLSRNNLIGNIIQKIGQMKRLECLDLSQNKLSGPIPIGLAQLNFLSVLDLFNNNLSGKIPSGTQLQSFDPSNYDANPELCGMPLPNKCSWDDIAPPPSTSEQGKDNNQQEDEEDDPFITREFFVSVFLGFAFGFWAVFGTLQLKKSWENAYLKFLENMKDWLYVTTTLNLARLRGKFRG